MNCKAQHKLFSRLNSFCGLGNIPTPFQKRCWENTNLEHVGDEEKKNTTDFLYYTTSASKF